MCDICTWVLLTVRDCRYVNMQQDITISKTFDVPTQSFLSRRSACWIISLVCVLITIYVSFHVSTKQTITTGKKKQTCADRMKDKGNTEIRVVTDHEGTKNSSARILLGNGTYKLKNPNGTTKNQITWSQNGQDNYLDKLFQQRRNGFFVEIGGYDGESFSNTLFFEKERGWSGLMVEANPYAYKIMVEKDRKCYMMNACISDSVPCMSFILAGAITSAEETLTDRHRKRIDEEDKVYGGKSETWVHSTETVDVNCFSLISLMKVLNRTYIDYFSLDVEGAEMFILKSIDWNKLDIDVFTIETDQHRQDILQFMRNHGYKWIVHLGGDDIFRKIK